ncbi:EPIDERMAL PATTERNING FACTOR-like protein 8 [Benincasa hispida]|uniref:EPIDERMAL PATTERNING FACTOR-like protein 8 n=1 Tax=Benincasa hispida TaxID=102211 RepID=UPI0019024E29|nr:EPIDERMAL PATTERNING FACTOR-like protein 8 [Benincasa hispida]
MASPRSVLKLVIAIAVVFSLLLPLPTSSALGDIESLQKKMVLGSKPPRCVGKCLNCRPCTAALVVPEHRERKGFEANLDRREEDDSYYLLHWKCKCGNKLYQP